MESSTGSWSARGFGTLALEGESDERQAEAESGLRSGDEQA